MVLELGVGLYEAEHRCERGLDHPRALGLGADPHRAAGKRDLDRRALLECVCRHDRLLEILFTICGELPCALGDAGDDRLNVHLNSNHAGRADRYLVRANSERGCASRLHCLSDFVSVVSCRSVGVAAVGDDGAELPEVAALARQHHWGRLDS